MTNSANRSLGRSAVRACLLEGEVNLGSLAKQLEWTWQRTYSVAQTISRQQKKSLIRVCKGVYKLEDVNEEK